jgi:hypothetical protein
MSKWQLISLHVFANVTLINRNWKNPVVLFIICFCRQNQSVLNTSIFATTRNQFTEISFFGTFLKQPNFRFHLETDSTISRRIHHFFQKCAPLLAVS